jgi:uncharacterized coiled-coil protein SlyX
VFGSREREKDHACISVVAYMLMDVTKRQRLLAESRASQLIKENSRMAVPWLAVLKTVPWSDVISNAPLVADGAKKLWNAVSKKSAAKPESKPAEPPPFSDEARAIAALEERLAAAEAAVADLNGQMLATSELIKALAEQNALLIARVEVSRVRVLWLTGVSGTAVVVALISLAALLK